MGDAFLASREVGERHHNPHVQAAISRNCTKTLLTTSLRDCIDTAVAVHQQLQSVRYVVIIKLCAADGWVRLIGYCLKDKGLAHFMMATH